MLAVLGVAPAARAADFTGSSLTIEGFGGWQNLNFSTNNPGTSATNAAANAITGNEGTAMVGGDLLLKMSVFGIGLALDKTVSGAGPNNYQPWAGSLMLGLVFDLMPSLRLEALGEVGRYGGNIGDFFDSDGQTFLGLRPGISVRLLPSPIRLGISALIRWPTSGPNADFGSPNYGFIGRVGLEFP